MNRLTKTALVLTGTGAVLFFSRKKVRYYIDSFVSGFLDACIDVLTEEEQDGDQSLPVPGSPEWRAMVNELARLRALAQFVAKQSEKVLSGEDDDLVPHYAAGHPDDRHNSTKEGSENAQEHRCIYCAPPVLHEYDGLRVEIEQHQTGPYPGLDDDPNYRDSQPDSHGDNIGFGEEDTDPDEDADPFYDDQDGSAEK